MQIDTDAWQALHNQLGSSETSPPTPVYVAVYSLTRGAPIAASYAQQEARETSTRWHNWVITETSLLVHTELEFAEEHYDSYAEDNLREFNPDSTLEAEVRQAWVRRLDTVTSLDIDAVGRLTGRTTAWWYPIGNIKLTFEDGTNTTLPGQTRVPHQDREWSDRFINTLRDRVQL